MNDKKIFLAIPIYNNVNPLFFQCFVVFQAENRVNCDISIQIGDSLISRQRNNQARQFLESDCTHMLFIDSDLLFSADQVMRLASRNVDIIGGLYPKKSDRTLEFVLNKLADPSQAEQREDGIEEVQDIGTGFLMIKKEVFHTIAKNFPELEYERHDGETEYDFFKVGVFDERGKRRYLSEDYGFAHLARKCGYKIYVDNTVLLKHSGTQVFPTFEQEKLLKFDEIELKQ